VALSSPYHRGEVGLREVGHCVVASQDVADEELCRCSQPESSCRKGMMSPIGIRIPKRRIIDICSH
jgi:hypothetical protein